MKRITEYLKVAAAISVILLAASCEKEGIERFKGSYSFKTSGTLTVVRDSLYMNDTTYRIIETGDTTYYTIIGTDTIARIPDTKIDTVVTVHDEEMTLAVNVESGQMEINAINDDEMVMSMNIIGGGVAVYYANAEGEDFTVSETTRHLTIASFTVLDSDEEFGSEDIVSDVTITGDAKRYDNIILFDLDYAGDFWANSRLYHIVDSDMVCRAKANE